MRIISNWLVKHDPQTRIVEDVDSATGEKTYRVDHAASVSTNKRLNQKLANAQRDIDFSEMLHLKRLTSQKVEPSSEGVGYDIGDHFYNPRPGAYDGLHLAAGVFNTVSNMFDDVLFSWFEQPGAILARMRNRLDIILHSIAGSGTRN